MSLPEKLELKQECLHQVKGAKGTIRRIGNILYADEKRILESVDKDLFTEIVKRYNIHDDLMVVSHNLAETMGIDYAIKKLSTIDDDSMAIGAATILKGIQQQAKQAVAKA